MNKKLTYMIAVISAVSLVSAMVGSIDTECKEYGFDYGIAKFEATGNGFVLDEGIIGDFHIQVTGDKQHAVWKSFPSVDGVLRKSGSDTTVLAGGESGDVYGWNTTNPKGKPITKDISHITFCAYTPVPEFSATAAGVAIAAALGGFFLLRKR